MTIEVNAGIPGILVYQGFMLKKNLANSYWLNKVVNRKAVRLWYLYIFNFFSSLFQSKWIFRWEKHVYISLKNHIREVSLQTQFRRIACKSKEALWYSAVMVKLLEIESPKGEVIWVEIYVMFRNTNSFLIFER